MKKKHVTNTDDIISEYLGVQVSVSGIFLLFSRQSSVGLQTALVSFLGKIQPIDSVESVRRIFNHED